MCTRSLAIAAALAAAACGSASTGPSDKEATFEAVVDEVLVPSCTFSSCHTVETAAADLALTAETACGMLVDQPSCLFPDRMRVVPGSPETSFLFHKLIGEGLDEVPVGDCGSGTGSVMKTNYLMPYGAAELSQPKLDLVHAWIAGGAQCTPSGTIPTPKGPAIASITASNPTPVAGQSLAITVTLDRPAPEDGLPLTIETDLTVLNAPVKALVPAGETSTRFNAYAARPTSRFTVRVNTGESAKDLVLRIGGLLIAEVLSDPVGDDDQLQWIKLRNTSPVEIILDGYQLKAGQSSYDLVTVPLTGTLPAGGCALIGGPSASGTNGEPNYFQSHDFVPDLPYLGAQAAGFAVFDAAAVPLGNLATPVDTMLVGAANAKLLNADAEIASPYCGTPLAGTTALRTGPSTCVQAAMQPYTCN